MTRASDACDRLAVTRAQLRLAMRTGLRPDPPVTQPRTSGWMGLLWDRLKTGPGTGPIVQRVEEWSARSAVAASGRLAADAIDATLRPIAQRHPWRLAVGVFVLSGLVVWRRPWRRVVSPALLMAVLPPLFSVLVGSAPRPAWVSLARAVLNRGRSAAQRG